MGLSNQKQMQELQKGLYNILSRKEGNQERSPVNYPTKLVSLMNQDINQFNQDILSQNKESYQGSRASKKQLSLFQFNRLQQYNRSRKLSDRQNNLKLSNRFQNEKINSNYYQQNFKLSSNNEFKSPISSTLTINKLRNSQNFDNDQNKNNKNTLNINHNDLKIPRNKSQNVGLRRNIIRYKQMDSQDSQIPKIISKNQDLNTENNQKMNQQYLTNLFNSLGTAFLSAEHNKDMTESQKRFIEDLDYNNSNKESEVQNGKPTIQQQIVMQDQLHSNQTSNLNRKRSSVALLKTKSRNETVMKNILDDQQKPDDQQSLVNSFGDSQLNVIFQDFNNLKRSSTKVAEPKIGEILKDVIIESRYQQNGYMDNLQTIRLKNKEQNKNLQNMVQTILVASRSQGGWSQINEDHKNFQKTLQIKKEYLIENKVIKKDDPQKCYKIPSISKCLEFKILPKTSKILQNLCIQMAHNPQNEINQIEKMNLRNYRPISFRNTDSNFFNGVKAKSRLVTQEKKFRNKKRIFSHNQISPDVNGSQPEIKTNRNSQQSLSQQSLFLNNQGSDQTFFQDQKKANEALKNNCKKIFSHQNNQYLQIPINNHKLKLNPSDEKHVILSKNAQQNEMKIINQKGHNEKFTQSVDQNLYSLESNSEMFRIAPQLLKISQYENTLQNSLKFDENKQESLAFIKNLENQNENRKLHISTLDPFQIFDKNLTQYRNENFEQKFNSLQKKEDVQNKQETKKKKKINPRNLFSEKSNQDLQQFYNNRNDWQKDLPVQVKYNLVNNFNKDKPLILRHPKTKHLKKQLSKNSKKQNQNSQINLLLNNTSDEFEIKKLNQVKEIKKEKSLLKIQMHIDLQELADKNIIDTIPSKQREQKSENFKFERKTNKEQKYKLHKKTYQIQDHQNLGGISANPSNHTVLRSRQGLYFSQDRILEATISSNMDQAQKSILSKQITPLHFEQSNLKHNEQTLSRAQAESFKSSSQKKNQDSSYNNQGIEKGDSKQSYILETNIHNFDKTYIKDNDSNEVQEQVFQINSPSILKSVEKQFDLQQQNSFTLNVISQKSQKKKSIEFQNMAILQKIGLKKNVQQNEKLQKAFSKNQDIYEIDRELQMQDKFISFKAQDISEAQKLQNKKKKILIDNMTNSNYKQSEKVDSENKLFNLQNIGQKNYQTVYISNEDKQDKAIIYQSSSVVNDQILLNNNQVNKFSSIQIEYRTLGGETNNQNDKNIEESSYDILLSNNKKEESKKRGKSASISRFTRKEYKLFETINRLHSAQIHLNCQKRKSVEQGQQTLTQEQIDNQQNELNVQQQYNKVKNTDNQLQSKRQYKCGSQSRLNFKESNTSAILLKSHQNRNSDHFKQIVMPQDNEKDFDNNNFQKYQFESKFNLQFNQTQRAFNHKNKLEEKSNSHKDFKKQLQSLQIRKIKESMPTGHFRKSFAAFQQIHSNEINFENQITNENIKECRRKSEKDNNKIKIKIKDTQKSNMNYNLDKNEFLNKIAFKNASQKSIFKSVHKINSERKLSLNGSDICLKQQLKDIESYAEEMDYSPKQFDQFQLMTDTFNLLNHMQPIELKQYEINQQMSSTQRSHQNQQSSRNFFIRKKQAQAIKSVIQASQGQKSEMTEIQNSKFQNFQLKVSLQYFQTLFYKDQNQKQIIDKKQNNNGFCTLFEINLDQQNKNQNVQQIFLKKKKVIKFIKKTNDELEQKQNKKIKEEQKLKKFELTSLEYDKKKNFYQVKKTKKESSIDKEEKENKIQQYSLLNSINIPMMNPQREKQQNSRSIVIIGKSGDNMGMDTQRIDGSMNNGKQLYKDQDELDWEDYPQQYIQSSLTDL